MTRYTCDVDPAALTDYLLEHERRTLRLLRESWELRHALNHGLLDPEMVERRAVLLVGLGEHRRDDLALLRVPRTRIGRGLLWVAVMLGEVARAVG